MTQVPAILRILRSFGPSTLNFRSVLREADAARDSGRFQEGARAYARALQIVPAAVGLEVQLGHCLKETGQYAEARAAYERFRSLHPDDADIHLQLGHLEKLAGNREPSLAAYTEALRLAGAESAIGRAASQEIDSLTGLRDPAEFRRAFAMLNDRDFEGAYHGFMRAMNFDAPGRYAVLLGHACKETGRFEEAERWYGAYRDFADQNREREPDLWLDAVIQFGMLETLRRNYLAAMQVYAAAAVGGEATGIGDTDRFWHMAQGSLARMTGAIRIA